MEEAKEYLKKAVQAESSKYSGQCVLSLVMLKYHYNSIKKQ